MRIAVSNSTPLIFLAKIRSLNILEFFFDEIYIPPAVYKEVIVDGLENGHADALLLHKFLLGGKLQVRGDFQQTPDVLKYQSKALHQGEIDAIYLALSVPNDVLLLDEEEARKLARFLNLQVKGTLGLLIAFRRAGKITFEQSMRKLSELNEIMYLSTDVYLLVEKNLR